MTTEQKDKREEWWKYNKQGGPITWRDIDSGNLMDCPLTVVAAAARPSEPEAARTRLEESTRELDYRLGAIVAENRRTGESYASMLQRGAISGSDYATLGAFSRLDGGDF